MKEKAAWILQSTVGARNDTHNGRRPWSLDMPCAALMSELTLVCISRQAKHHAMDRNLLLVKQQA